MKIQLLMILSFFLFACTMMKVVDVPESRKAIQKNLDGVYFGLTKIDSDLISLQTVTNTWSDNETKKRLSQLTFAQRNILQTYTRTKEDFESSKFSGKQKVTEQQKDYPLVKKEQDDFNNRLSILEKQLADYRMQRNALVSYLESKKIVRVDAQRLNADFISALNEAKRTQLSIKNELMDYNVKFNQTEMPAEKKAQQKIVIQDLVKIVEKMENETFRLQRVHVATAQEVVQGVKFVTPKMRAYAYPEKIKLIMDGIKAEAEKFNTLAKKLE